MPTIAPDLSQHWRAPRQPVKKEPRRTGVTFNQATRLNMTIEQRIKRQIIKDALKYGEYPIEVPAEITAENVDKMYDELDENDYIQDARADFRCSGENTGLPAEFSRHFESDAVGKRLDDGTWVGWIYWHGGGKHGEPEAIDWMDCAYELAVTEEEKLVTVRTFAIAVHA